RYGAGGCRCAARSSRRKCQFAPPVRHWSAPSAADRSRSRARPNVSQSRNSLLCGLRLGERAAVTIKHAVDLGEEIVVHGLIANIDRVGKAFGADSAMALHHHPVETEQPPAIGFVGVELVSQLLEGAAGKEVADPGKPSPR